MPGCWNGARRQARCYWSRRHHRWYAYVWTNVIRPGPWPGPSYMAHIYGAPEDDRIIGVRRAARNVERVYLHTRPPAAPYRKPEPGENFKPEWLRRILWARDRGTPIQISELVDCHSRPALQHERGLRALPASRRETPS